MQHSIQGARKATTLVFWDPAAVENNELFELYVTQYELFKWQVASHPQDNPEKTNKNSLFAPPRYHTNMASSAHTVVVSITNDEALLQFH